MTAHAAWRRQEATETSPPAARRWRTVVTPLALAAAVAAAIEAPADRVLVCALLAGVLVLLGATDLERRVIPNRVVLPATALALLANSALVPSKAGEWVLAAAVAALLLGIPHAMRSAWVGMGDVKLALLLGAGLGWAAITAIALAFACVFPFAFIALLRGGAAARKTQIPFGPFLAAGGLLVLFGAHVAGLPTG